MYTRTQLGVNTFTFTCLNGTVPKELTFALASATTENASLISQHAMSSFVKFA